jgi:transposase-like protein
MTDTHHAIIKADQRGRLRFTPDQRAILLAAYDTSGLSAMAFARGHGVCYQTLIAWQRKCREQPSIPAAHSGPAFAPTNFPKIDLPFSAGRATLRLEKMAYNLTPPSSGKSAMRPKNRAWGFSRNGRALPLENRRRCPKPRWKSRPTPTIFTPGIPQWPSRDPIGERGGVNLYGFVGNDGVDIVDILGFEGDCPAAFNIPDQYITWAEEAWQATVNSAKPDTEGGPVKPMTETGVVIFEILQKGENGKDVPAPDGNGKSKIGHRCVDRKYCYPDHIESRGFALVDADRHERGIGKLHTHPSPNSPPEDRDKTLSCRDIEYLSVARSESENFSIVRSENCIFIVTISSLEKLKKCRDCCSSKTLNEGISRAAADRTLNQSQKGEAIMKPVFAECGLCYYKVCKDKNGKFPNKAPLQK